MKKRKMNKKAIVTTTVKSPSKQRIWLIALGIGLLVAIGAFGAMSEQGKNNLLSNVAETVGFKKKEIAATEAIQPQTGTPQLSKEYVYAGSRMLATEDYGIAPTNPTPTPLPPGGGGTPTPTPIGTPTPTPTPDPVTGCPGGHSSLGGVIITNPTAEIVNGRVVVFATGTDFRLYYQYSTGGAFSGWNVITQGGTYQDAMSTVINSVMYLELQGGDNNRYYSSSTDGMNFSGFVQGSVNAYQTHPSAIFNGNTYNFVKGAGSSPHLCVQVTAGGATPTPTPTPPTSLAVTVTVAPTSVYTGEDVTVNWSANEARPTTDYLAVYRGATQVSTQNITSGTSGSTTITMNTIGTYTVKYFVQGNSTPIATSNTFIVQRIPRGDP